MISFVSNLAVFFAALMMLTQSVCFAHAGQCRCSMTSASACLTQCCCHNPRTKDGVPSSCSHCRSGSSSTPDPDPSRDDGVHTSTGCSCHLSSPVQEQPLPVSSTLEFHDLADLHLATVTCEYEAVCCRTTLFPKTDRPALALAAEKQTVLCVWLT
ncbi:hypothetical protein ACYFX5_25500 [Bremerella sp. T1]|uniref:hypothetical protein n=1 Tax=Bremerella sp. TYQ1 TaxID=3119568 RepID=UPI001CCAD6AB|nr:hypothetical protein [Bremerella volcania]UBM36368.1 hypothetical protein LA756_00355 [Bremerella volcania]